MNLSCNLKWGRILPRATVEAFSTPLIIWFLRYGSAHVMRMVIRPFQWGPKHHGHILKKHENGLMTISPKTWQFTQVAPGILPSLHVVIFPVSGEQIGC